MIEVVEYDPEWPCTYSRLCDRLAAALDTAGVPYVAIEHVGSTAVPGLAAKPVIDCDIVVAEEQVAAASAVLEGLGYTPLGEPGNSMMMSESVAHLVRHRLGHHGKSGASAIARESRDAEGRVLTREPLTRPE